jgi:hypothetical protein
VPLVLAAELRLDVVANLETGFQPTEVWENLIEGGEIQSILIAPS